jgi:hypothetical protein
VYIVLRSSARAGRKRQFWPKRFLVTLVQQLNQQLNKDLDHCCFPLGDFKARTSEIPFKIVCARYSYTVIGKGITDRLWKEMSNEAIIYRILRKAQGSAVPVFLGKTDLAMSTSFTVRVRFDICCLWLGAARQ